jgi:hypothetical protein
MNGAPRICGQPEGGDAELGNPYPPPIRDETAYEWGTQIDVGMWVGHPQRSA